LVDLAPGVNNRGGSSNSILQGYTSGRGTNGAVLNGASPERIGTSSTAFRASTMTPEF
jgi:hypothetical protein